MIADILRGVCSANNMVKVVRPLFGSSANLVMNKSVKDVNHKLDAWWLDDPTSSPHMLEHKQTICKQDKSEQPRSLRCAHISDTELEKPWQIKLGGKKVVNAIEMVERQATEEQRQLEASRLSVQILQASNKGLRSKLGIVVVEKNFLLDAHWARVLGHCK